MPFILILTGIFIFLDFYVLPSVAESIWIFMFFLEPHNVFGSSCLSISRTKYLDFYVPPSTAQSIWIFMFFLQSQKIFGFSCSSISRTKYLDFHVLPSVIESMYKKYYI